MFLAGMILGYAVGVATCLVYAATVIASREDDCQVEDFLDVVARQRPQVFRAGK